MNLKKQAFTLVELIVVITILAILGTIAFISMQGYSKSSRDSVRISDVSNMKTSLELFHLNAGKYPLPDNGEEVLYDTELLWTQGTFGETVRQTLSRNLSKIPKDPLSNKEYVYSTSNNRNEFQILNLLETDLALNTINQTNAVDTTRIPKIIGQYNGVFIKTLSYIVPIPSIINSEVTVGGLTLDISNIKSQIVDGGDNMLNIGNVASKTGQLDINLSVYTGSVVTGDLDSKKATIMTVIQGAYTGSTLATEGLYKYILSITGEIELAGLTDTIILDGNNIITPVVITDADCTAGTIDLYNYGSLIHTQTGTVTKAIIGSGTDIDPYIGSSAIATCNNGIVTISSDILYTSCKTILDNNSGQLNQNGVYTIDPENNIVGFNVYCDMTTTGGGWTAIVSNLNTSNFGLPYGNLGLNTSYHNELSGDNLRSYYDGSTYHFFGIMINILFDEANVNYYSWQTADSCGYNSLKFICSGQSNVFGNYTYNDSTLTFVNGGVYSDNYLTGAYPVNNCNVDITDNMFYFKHCKAYGYVGDVWIR